VKIRTIPTIAGAVLAAAVARFSDNCFHLEAGAPAEVTVRPSTRMTRAALEKALKVRSLFDTYRH
jgi:hypothetical protein